MEEKKSNGISVSAFFLIIAIIVIFAMGYFIYKLYNDKTNEGKRTDELLAQVDSLNVTIGELQEKIEKINNISETIEDENKDETVEIDQNIVDQEDINNASKELTFSELLQKIYPNNTGKFSMKVSYITITAEYNNNESEVEVIVNENDFRDPVGKVKLGIDPSSGANRDIEYTNLNEKIVDVLIDVNSDGKISAITLLTSTGKAYTTPWEYRYNDTQANLFEMGENITRLSYDEKGGCGYDKNGNIVFHTEDIYRDGY